MSDTNNEQLKPGTYDVRIGLRGRLDVTPNEMTLTLVLTSRAFHQAVHCDITFPNAPVAPEEAVCQVQAHQLLLAKYPQAIALQYIAEFEREHGIAGWGLYFLTDAVHEQPTLDRTALADAMDAYVQAIEWGNV